MKYKTLTRIILKLMGVYFIFGGLQSMIFDSSNWVYQRYLGDHEPYRPLWWEISTSSISTLFGLYLFFGGKWILNRIIPSNRPYCHECGYDLSHTTSPQCPECGVAVPVAKEPTP